ncbi:hypothetical protein KIPB_001156 [Kipferlia bialata]|uniref:Uncharacterized protein n=1 Tax=Kipferlia bialata TaxID=797122 RepID=A0A9K3GF02_9EUKA|nr:hypothetical protein KIPB_001156 [Kipferlia bialata]|eukprot:g1156.t1
MPGVPVDVRIEEAGGIVLAEFSVPGLFDPAWTLEAVLAAAKEDETGPVTVDAGTEGDMSMSVLTSRIPEREGAEKAQSLDEGFIQDEESTEVEETKAAETKPPGDEFTMSLLCKDPTGASDTMHVVGLDTPVGMLTALVGPSHTGPLILTATYGKRPVTPAPTTLADSTLANLKFPTLSPTVIASLGGIDIDVATALFSGYPFLGTGHHDPLAKPTLSVLSACHGAIVTLCESEIMQVLAVGSVPVDTGRRGVSTQEGRHHILSILLSDGSNASPLATLYAIKAGKGNAEWTPVPLCISADARVVLEGCVAEGEDTACVVCGRDSMDGSIVAGVGSGDSITHILRLDATQETPTLSLACTLERHISQSVSVGEYSTLSCCGDRALVSHGTAMLGSMGPMESMGEFGTDPTPTHVICVSLSTGSVYESTLEGQGHTLSPLGTVLIGPRGHLQMAVKDWMCAPLPGDIIQYSVHGTCLVYTDTDANLVTMDLSPFLHTHLLPASTDYQTVSVPWRERGSGIEPFPPTLSGVSGLTRVAVSLSQESLELVGLAECNYMTGEWSVTLEPKEGVEVMPFLTDKAVVAGGCMHCAFQGQLLSVPLSREGEEAPMPTLYPIALSGQPLPCRDTQFISLPTAAGYRRVRVAPPLPTMGSLPLVPCVLPDRHAVGECVGRACVDGVVCSSDACYSVTGGVWESLTAYSVARAPDVTMGLGTKRQREREMDDAGVSITSKEDVVALSTTITDSGVCVTDTSLANTLARRRVERYTFTQCIFSDLSGASLDTCTFRECNLTGCVLSNVTLLNCTFAKCNLTDITHISGATVVQTTFTECEPADIASLVTPPVEGAAPLPAVQRERRGATGERVQPREEESRPALEEREPTGGETTLTGDTDMVRAPPVSKAAEQEAVRVEKEKPNLEISELAPVPPPVVKKPVEVVPTQIKKPKTPKPTGTAYPKATPAPAVGEREPFGGKREAPPMTAATVLASFAPPSTPIQPLSTKPVPPAKFIEGPGVTEAKVTWSGLPEMAWNQITLVVPAVEGRAVWKLTPSAAMYLKSSMVEIMSASSRSRRLNPATVTRQGETITIKGRAGEYTHPCEDGEEQEVVLEVAQRTVAGSGMTIRRLVKIPINAFLNTHGELETLILRAPYAVSIVENPKNVVVVSVAKSPNVVTFMNRHGADSRVAYMRRTASNAKLTQSCIAIRRKQVTSVSNPITVITRCDAKAAAKETLHTVYGFITRVTEDRALAFNSMGTIRFRGNYEPQGSRELPKSLEYRSTLPQDEDKHTEFKEAQGAVTRKHGRKLMKATINAFLNTDDGVVSSMRPQLDGDACRVTIIPLTNVRADDKRHVVVVSVSKSPHRVTYMARDGPERDVAYLRRSASNCVLSASCIATRHKAPAYSPNPYLPTTQEAPNQTRDMPLPIVKEDRTRTEDRPAVISPPHASAIAPVYLVAPPKAHTSLYTVRFMGMGGRGDLSDAVVEEFCSLHGVEDPVLIPKGDNGGQHNFSGFVGRVTKKKATVFQARRPTTFGAIYMTCQTWKPTEDLPKGLLPLVKELRPPEPPKTKAKKVDKTGSSKPKPNPKPKTKTEAKPNPNPNSKAQTKPKSQTNAKTHTVTKNKPPKTQAEAAPLTQPVKPHINPKIKPEVHVQRQPRRTTDKKPLQSLVVFTPVSIVVLLFRIVFEV